MMVVLYGINTHTGDTDKIISDGFSAMPEGMRGYLKKIAELTGVPISIASLSPDRAHTLQKGLYEMTCDYI